MRRVCSWVVSDNKGASDGRTCKVLWLYRNLHLRIVVFVHVFVHRQLSSISLHSSELNIYAHLWCMCVACSAQWGLPGQVKWAIARIPTLAARRHVVRTPTVRTSRHRTATTKMDECGTHLHGMHCGACLHAVLRAISTCPIYVPYLRSLSTCPIYVQSLPRIILTFNQPSLSPFPQLFVCSLCSNCLEGFKMAADGTTCKEINACENHPCGDANHAEFQKCVDKPPPFGDSVQGRLCLCEAPLQKQQDGHCACPDESTAPITDKSGVVVCTDVGK